jgi:hypothetical protein
MNSSVDVSFGDAHNAFSGRTLTLEDTSASPAVFASAVHEDPIAQYTFVWP